MNKHMNTHQHECCHKPDYRHPSYPFDRSGCDDGCHNDCHNCEHNMMPGHECCHHHEPPHRPKHPTNCPMIESSFVLANKQPFLFDNTHMRYFDMLSVGEQVITRIDRRRDDSHINLYGTINMTENVVNNEVLNHCIEQLLSNTYETNKHVVPVMKAVMKFIVYFHVEDYNGGIVYENSHEYHAKDGFMHVTDVDKYLVASFKTTFCHNIPRMTYTGTYNFVIDKIRCVASCIDTKRHLTNENLNVFYQFTHNNTRLSVMSDNIRNTDTDFEIVLAEEKVNYSTTFTANITTRFTLTSTIFLDNFSSTLDTFGIWNALNNPTNQTMETLVDKVHHLEHMMHHIVHRNAYSNIKKIQPYLFDVTYSEPLDYHFGKSFMKHRYTDMIGGCTSVRKGNFYGRNYDWTYDMSSSFVVRVKRSISSRYASIGMSGGIPTLTDEFVEHGDFSELYAALPFIMLDGINECGVVANINVVPTGDYGITTGTTPKLDVKDTICAMMIVRYVLDRFDTADAAVTYLQNHVSVYAPNKEGGLQQELHVMIADKDNTYLIEFINNTMVVHDMDVVYGGRTYMTNFYLYKTALLENTNKIDYATVTDYGSGLERYDYITNHIDDVDSIESMTTLMTNLNYTNTYKPETNPFWYTEYVYPEKHLTIHSTHEQFAPTVYACQQSFENRSRKDGGKTWQTVHTSVYDIENHSFYLLSQEESKGNQKKISFAIPWTEADAAEFEELKERVAIQEQMISDLTDALRMLTERVTTAEEKIETNIANIETNTNDIATNKSNISINKTNISSNTSEISNIKTRLTTDETNISLNTSKIGDNETNIASNASMITTLSNSLQTTDGNVSALGERMVKAEQDIKDLQDTVVDIT